MIDRREGDPGRIWSRYATIVLLAAGAASTSLGIAASLSGLWAVANILLYAVGLLCLAFAGRQAVVPLVAGTLVVYGSWGVIVAAQRMSSPFTFGLLSKNSLEYVTWATLAVAIGLLASLILSARPSEPRKIAVAGRSRRIEDGGQLNFDAGGHIDWRWVLLPEAIGMSSLLLYVHLAGGSLLSHTILSGTPSLETTAALQAPFLLAAVDVLIPASLLALSSGQKTVRNSIYIINALVFISLGFKYRIVVLLIATLIALPAARPAIRISGGRLIAALCIGIVAFFGMQALRDYHQAAVTGSSVTLGARNLVSTYHASIDLASAYSAIHAAHFPLLYGKSYEQLPLLLIPQVLLPDKPAPAMLAVVQAVTTPGAGAAVPLWAEADQNFGVVGLLLFGGLMGYVVRRIERLCSTPDLWQRLVGAAATGLLLSALSRSVMLFAVQQVIFMILPLLLMRRLVRASTDPATSVAQSSESSLPEPVVG